MKKLKFETLPVVHVVEYNDWDKFIRESFPKCPYDSIVSEEEMNNYSSFTHKSEEMEQEKRIKVKEYLDGKDTKKDHFISTRDIIDLLVSYEDLPKGMYVITIFW